MQTNYWIDIYNERGEVVDTISHGSLLACRRAARRCGYRPIRAQDKNGISHTKWVNYQVGVTAKPGPKPSEQKKVKAFTYLDPSIIDELKEYGVLSETIRMIVTHFAGPHASVMDKRLLSSILQSQRDLDKN